MLESVLLLAVLAVPAPRLEPTPQFVERAEVAPGTAWNTEVVHVDSGLPGPTVLVVGGVHGDEPAGALAAEEIAGWRPTRGRLVVVPRTNELALAAGSRLVPTHRDAKGAVDGERDLNRTFPTHEGDEPEGALSAAIWELVREIRPDYLVDLHEGYDFTQVEPKSVGSSIISDATPASLARAAAMVATLNSTIADEKKQFVVKQVAVSGSLARAAHDVLGIPSMIVETTTKGQAEAFRARQHRILVATFLTGLDMLDHGPDVLVGTAADADDVKVAMYVSAGVGGSGPDRIEELLESYGDFVVRRVCASDLRAGVLEQFDVVIFPGGSASSQAASIREDGREAVREFVESGGGYLGICAGAYLAANNYEWSLGILDADVVDREHWARGTGDVAIEFSGLGATTLSTGTREAEIHYANGPIFARSRDREIPNYRVLAWFRGEVLRTGVPGGVMPDTPAMVVGRFGEGRVVCSSPHPEQTDGMEEVVAELVRLAAGS
ncbi:MAG: BPL-N domain-containing protein [Planctomycetota bacterium]